jgi:hypothetical protein
VVVTARGAKYNRRVKFKKVASFKHAYFAYMEGNGLNGLKLYGAAGIDLHYKAMLMQYISNNQETLSILQLTIKEQCK